MAAYIMQPWDQLLSADTRGLSVMDGMVEARGFRERTAGFSLGVAVALHPYEQRIAVRVHKQIAGAPHGFEVEGKIAVSTLPRNPFASHSPDPLRRTAAAVYDRVRAARARLRLPIRSRRRFRYSISDSSASLTNSRFSGS